MAHSVLGYVSMWFNTKFVSVPFKLEKTGCNFIL